MKRTAAFLGGVLLLWSVHLGTAAEAPGLGTWKLNFSIPTAQGEVELTFLVMLSESDGKQVGDVLGTNLKVEPTIDGVAVKDGAVRFALKLGDQPMVFDGKLSKDGKRIKGSIELEGNLLTVEMMPSKLKNLKDPFANRREIIDNLDDGSEFFGALGGLFEGATDKKLKAEEVRAYADKATKAAEPYGIRFQRHIALKIASSLAGQESFTPVALEQARAAERMVSGLDDALSQMDTLTTLAGIMRKAKQDAEVKKLEQQLTKLEVRDYAEYAKKSPPFQPDEFKGRNAKKDQVVLVELFTGAECPPCVAVDLAFDALERTYKPSEVIFLQYHLHIPRPDPLCNADVEARQSFYGDKIRGTPSIFFNGKKDTAGGGPSSVAKRKYDGYRKEIETAFDREAPLKLSVGAVAKGDEIAIKANVSGVEKPSEKIALRLALVEERVRYTGGNGLRYHHSVVRAMPGGAKGLPLTKATGEQTATVKLEELRKSLDKYLDDYAKDNQETFANKPLGLRNLKVVAFVQNDETGEVLQAAQAEVKE